MATILLEECGKAKKGQGENLARETLTSGKALDKFWEIAIAQGQKAPIKSEDIKVGDLTSEIVAHKSGKIMSINTRGMVDITRALGTPKIKEAGIYLNKHLGDVVEKGDVIATLYSVTESRLNLGKEVANVEENWDIV
jgi:thymidine phosphorylase